MPFILSLRPEPPVVLPVKICLKSSRGGIRSAPSRPVSPAFTRKSEDGRLKDVGSRFGAFAALTAGEFDVGADGLLPEAVDDVDEPVARGIHVRVVDLVGIPRQHDLGAMSHPG